MVLGHHASFEVGLVIWSIFQAPFRWLCFSNPGGWQSKCSQIPRPRKLKQEYIQRWEPNSQAKHICTISKHSIKRPKRPSDEDLILQMTGQLEPWRPWAEQLQAKRRMKLQMKSCAWENLLMILHPRSSGNKRYDTYCASMSIWLVGRKTEENVGKVSRQASFDVRLVHGAEASRGAPTVSRPGDGSCAISHFECRNNFRIFPPWDQDEAKHWQSVEKCLPSMTKPPGVLLLYGLSPRSAWLRMALHGSAVAVGGWFFRVSCDLWSVERSPGDHTRGSQEWLGLASCNLAIDVVFKARGWLICLVHEKLRTRITRKMGCWFSWGFTTSAWDGSNPWNSWQRLNMVTRIYTTVCFWHPCAKTPHVLSFFQWPISTSDDESFKSLFFPSRMWSSCHVSLRHVVTIDPLIDSIPDSSIDGWASAVLHLTGAKFFEVVPTTINLLGSCNFRLSASVQETYINVAWRSSASVQERYINVAWCSFASVEERYINVALRRCASVQERYINVALRGCASVQERYINVALRRCALRRCASVQERYINVAPRRCASVQERYINVALRRCALRRCASVQERYINVAPRRCASVQERYINVALRRCASVQERYINVAWRSSASVHGRY